MLKKKMIFLRSRPIIIGMLHVPALPGTPKNRMNMHEICEFVRKETIIYKSFGIDAVLVENMNDLPYLPGQQVGPEIVANMTRVCSIVKETLKNATHKWKDLRTLYNKPLGNRGLIPEYKFEAGKLKVSCSGFTEVGDGKTECESSVEGLTSLCTKLVDEGILSNDELMERLRGLEKNSTNDDHHISCSTDTEPEENKDEGITDRDIPIGVQILAGANKQAVAVAQAAGLDFVRVEGFVFSHVADEGLMNACAGELLRYRRHIGAEHIQIFTDIKKKHSAHAITSDVSIVETAQAAEMFGSDGIILTGTATGAEANPQQLQDVKAAVSIPVLIGSGITCYNVQNYKSANAFIVGSHLKVQEKWWNSINMPRVVKFKNTVINKDWS